MSLRLRALQLRAATEAETFGRDLRFENGLVVIRAENSMGKTTATNSIIYALGMEALITDRHAVPLTAAMTQQLEAPDGRRLAVSESYVQLEIENARGEIRTLQRYAKRPGGDTRTIRVWDGRRITAPSPSDQYRDMLARVRGSGVGELAIGRWLEEFLDWDLPVIAMPDGAERRLYPELVMPLMFVEQRAGWTGIQAAMPTYGIPDVRKRAREFVLGLSVYARQRRRLELRREGDELEREWTAAARATSERLGAVGMRLTYPASIDADFDDTSPLNALDLRSHQGLDVERAALSSELAAISESPDGAARTDDELAAEEARLRQLEPLLQLAIVDARSRDRQLATLARERTALKDQLRRLDEDLARNKDAQRLLTLGGEAWTDDDRDCPTCYQPLPVTLIGTLDRPAMTVQQNIAYLRQQQEVVEASMERTSAEERRTREDQRSARRAIADVRAEVRALRDALVRARGVPSAAQLQRQLILEQRIRELDDAEVEVGRLRDELMGIATRASVNRAAIAGLPSDTLTADDEQRIAELQKAFESQLRLYQPESVPVDELRISRESYLPAAGDVDLGFQISASDSIRLIWAYLLALLELDRTIETPHPGLVIFDEPRQQSAAERSLRQLLTRAAESRRHGQQVVFATSEPRERLDQMLADLDVQYVPIDGRFLVPVIES